MSGQSVIRGIVFDDNGTTSLQKVSWWYDADKDTMGRKSYGLKSCQILEAAYQVYQ